LLYSNPKKGFVLNPSSNPNSDSQKIPISDTKNNFVSPKNELTWEKKILFLEFVGPQVLKNELTLK
jgi:hypothetical protein